MHDSEADVVAINKISISRLLNFPSDVFSPFHQLRLLCSLVLTLNMDCNLVGKGQSFDIFQKNLKSFQSGPRVLLQQGLDVACGTAGPPGGFEGFNWRV